MFFYSFRCFSFTTVTPSCTPIATRSFFQVRFYYVSELCFYYFSSYKFAKCAERTNFHTVVHCKMSFSDVENSSTLSLFSLCEGKKKENRNILLCVICFHFIIIIIAKINVRFDGAQLNRMVFSRYLFCSGKFLPESSNLSYRVYRVCTHVWMMNRRKINTTKSTISISILGLCVFVEIPQNIEFH